MKEKFAPGPWKYDGIRSIISESTGEIIESDIKPFSKNAVPNALLKAAAPDMYEALNILNKHLVALANSKATPTRISSMIYGFLDESKAKAALSKANPQ